jgi:hypothetical protein
MICVSRKSTPKIASIPNGSCVLWNEQLKGGISDKVLHQGVHKSAHFLKDERSVFFKRKVPCI